MKLIHVTTAVACLSVTACAPGGGVGIMAMMADRNCQAAGYHLGTPEYVACRRDAAMQDAANFAAYQQANDLNLQRFNQQVHQSTTCTYNGQTSGSVTSGTMNCN